MLLLEEQKLPFWAVCIWVCCCNTSSAASRAPLSSRPTSGQREDTAVHSAWSPNCKEQQITGEKLCVCDEDCCLDCAWFLHGGVESAALSSNLTVVVHDDLFWHSLISDRQAAVHWYLCQCPWRMDKITSVLSCHAQN